MNQIECPNCGSRETWPMPSTAFERVCSACDETWDIRPVEETIDEQSWLK